MLARIITYLIIGILLVVAVAVSVPQYLTYLWIGLGFIFFIAVCYLTFVYIKRLSILLQQNKGK